MKKQTVVLYNMFSAYSPCEIHYKKRTDRNGSIIGHQQSQYICQKNWKKCVVSPSCKLYPRYADCFALLASCSQREGSVFSVKLLCSQFEREREIVNMQSYHL